MSSSGIQEVLEEIEELLASAGDLPPEADLAVEKLLNVVEAVHSAIEAAAQIPSNRHPGG